MRLPASCIASANPWTTRPGVAEHSRSLPHLAVEIMLKQTQGRAVTIHHRLLPLPDLASCSPPRKTRATPGRVSVITRGAQSAQSCLTIARDSGVPRSHEPARCRVWAVPRLPLSVYSRTVHAGRSWMETSSACWHATLVSRAIQATSPWRRCCGHDRRLLCLSAISRLTPRG
jgi:hypothetical protein